MHEASVGRRAGEGGFALILAILSLMLLTFLGLTLATTTSTELQIATNYRWSQMALYNAEAGLEASRILLARGADLATKWQALLPERRLNSDSTPVTWVEGAPPDPPSTPAASGRDYYKEDCDDRGGVGYGRVLTVAGERWEEKSEFEGERVNGAFTIWIRRDLIVDNEGKYQDSDRDDALVIVAEGVAPYVGERTVFTQSRQATRVLETRLNLGLATVGKPCEGLSGQEGMGPSGDNYNPCAPLGLQEGVAKGLESAFGTAGSGETGSLRPTDR
jgi:hypothetical protein